MRIEGKFISNTGVGRDWGSSKSISVNGEELRALDISTSSLSFRLLADRGVDGSELEAAADASIISITEGRREENGK